MLFNLIALLLFRHIPSSGGSLHSTEDPHLIDRISFYPPFSILPRPLYYVVVGAVDITQHIPTEMESQQASSRHSRSQPALPRDGPEAAITLSQLQPSDQDTQRPQNSTLLHTSQEDLDEYCFQFLENDVNFSPVTHDVLLSDSSMEFGPSEPTHPPSSPIEFDVNVVSDEDPDNVLLLGSPGEYVEYIVDDNIAGGNIMEFSNPLDEVTVTGPDSSNLYSAAVSAGDEAEYFMDIGEYLELNPGDGVDYMEVDPGDISGLDDDSTMEFEPGVIVGFDNDDELVLVWIGNLLAVLIFILCIRGFFSAGCG